MKLKGLAESGWSVPSNPARPREDLPMTQAQDLKVVLDALDKVNLVLSDFIEPKRHGRERRCWAS